MGEELLALVELQDGVQDEQVIPAGTIHSEVVLLVAQQFPLCLMPQIVS